MPRPKRGFYIPDRIGPHGCWEIAWSEGRRTKRVSTGTADRRAANVALAQFILARDKAEIAHERRKIAGVLDFYLTHHVAERVVDKERAKYADIPVRLLLGELEPSEIDDARLIAYARARRSGAAGRKVGDGTIRRELQHLRAAMHYAARHGENHGIHILKVPLITLPPKPPARRAILSDAAMDRMMELATTERLYLFIALARYTAARKEAILGLTWERVNLEAGLIDYREPGRPETAKRRAVVPIDDALAPILREAMEHRGENVLVLGHDGQIRKSLDAVAEAAGCPHATPHVFRHTWATQAAYAGMAMVHIAAILADSVETVERNYIHLSPAHLHGALRDMRERHISGRNGGETPLQGATDSGQLRTTAA
jgi:integrase